MLKEFIKDIIFRIIGVIFITALILLISFLISSSNKMNPEDEAVAKQQKQRIAQKIKRCEDIVNRKIINVEDVNFRECAEYLENIYNENYSAGDRGSSIYEY